MSKGEYTRKTAGLKAYEDITGEQLPDRVTLAEIREFSQALPPSKRERCHQLYIEYMSIGRPEYLESVQERAQRRCGRGK